MRTAQNGERETGYVFRGKSPLFLGVVLGTRQNMGSSSIVERNIPYFPLPEIRKLSSCMPNVTKAAKYNHAL